MDFQAIVVRFLDAVLRFLATFELLKCLIFSRKNGFLGHGSWVAYFRFFSSKISAGENFVVLENGQKLCEGTGVFWWGRGHKFFWRRRKGGIKIIPKT